MADSEQVVRMWDRYGAGYDAVFTDANSEVARFALELAGLRSGMTLLDIAAGSGAMSIPAAQMGAQVLATDLSPVMLDLLRDRATAAGLDTIDTAVMDGTALEVGDRRFDLVTSQYGVMFFPESGLPEMRRVLAPGGSAVTITWAPENVALHVYRRAIERALPDVDLPPEVPLIAHPERLAPMMSEAGFGGVQLHTHTFGYPATSAEDVWDWMGTASPGYATFVASLDDDRRERLHRAVVDETEARYGSTFSALPMGSLIAIGRR